MSRAKLCKDQGKTEPITKSSDWIEASLEVPEKDISMSFDNSKLEPLFNESQMDTPIPPPRKAKKGIKEKIEAAAKSGLLALQPKKPVEEPLCIKKKIDYSCPCHDPKHKHNHAHNTVQEKNIVNKKEEKLEKSKKSDKAKETKRKKNLSVVSLPNYSDLKFTIANFNEIDESSSNETQIKASNISLPQEPKTGGSKSYMVRCRSFGSLLPQQLLEKLKPTPAHTNNNSIVHSAESDDSFGALEDWDLDLIEHYNPRDASLPRPRKPILGPEKRITSDIENQIITENDVEDSLVSQKKSSNTNSTETLLVGSTPPMLRKVNLKISDCSFEPNSLTSLYDSIEDYVKNPKKSDKGSREEIKTEGGKSTHDTFQSAEQNSDRKIIYNIIEQFLEIEKSNMNTS